MRSNTRKFAEKLPNVSDLDAKGAFSNPKQIFSYSQDSWDDVRLAAASGKLVGIADPSFATLKTNGSGSVGIASYLFDDIHVVANEQEIYFTLQLPHGYKEGTDLYPHVHWTPQTAPAGSSYVVWGLEYSWTNHDDVISNTDILTCKSFVPDPYTHELDSFPFIPGYGKKISSMIMCRLFRNSSDMTNDTYAHSVFLLELDFHYRSDSPGSKEMFVK